MAILGPHGEVLESEEKPRMAIGPGGSVMLTFTADGGQVEVDGSNILVFPRGEWIILPLDLWQQTFAKALVAGGARSAAKPD